MENLEIKEVEKNQELEVVDLNDNNVKKLVIHLHKKGILSSNNSSNLSEKDVEIIRFLTTLMHDREFIRKLLHRYDRKTQIELLMTADMNKIERFVYSSYFNQFRKVKYAKENGEKISKILPIRVVIDNIFIYHKNAHYHYNNYKDLYALVKKLKAKAYYDAMQNKAIDQFLSKITKRNKKK